jgi:phage N-6-adenine-methyltransferase
MKREVYASSETCEWATPQEFFDRLNEQHHFELDVCATPENAKCERFFTKEQDGLKQEWTGRCWMNPPYGREIGDWMRKAYESTFGGGNSGMPGSCTDGHCMVA